MEIEDTLFGGVDIKTLIIDPGSYRTKIGVSGNLVPSSLIPNYYAKQIKTFPSSNKKVKTNTQKTFTGNEFELDPQKFLLNSKIYRTIENSQINNIDLFLQQIESPILKLFPSETENEIDLKMTPVIISEPSPMTIPECKKMASYFFEEKQVPAFYMTRSSSLSAFSGGKTTALIFDCGHDSTSSCPVVDGFSLYTGYLKSNMAGNFVNKMLSKLLFDEYFKTINCKEDSNSNNNSDVKSKTKETKDNSKEKWEEILFNENFLNYYKKTNHIAKNKKVEISENYLEYAKENFAIDVKTDPNIQKELFGFMDLNSNEKSNGKNSKEEKKIKYTFPDNETVVFLEREKMCSPFNSLFEPLINETEDKEIFEGIHSLVFNSIAESDIDIKKELYSNIVIVGGTSKINGFRNKIMQELETSAQDFSSLIKIKVHQSENDDELEFSSWIGGSILACLGTFQKMWVAKKEYEEIGEQSLERKFY